MFWKQKQPISEPFVHETQCRRKYFRYCFQDVEWVTFQYLNQEVRLINLGAGGLSFRNPGLAKGDTLDLELELPGQDILVEGKLKVVAIDDQNVCHCHFIDLPRALEEKIHQYLLDKQKQAVRQERDPQ